LNATSTGAGNMARGIGARVVAGGNSVRFLALDPERADGLASKLQDQAQEGETATTSSLGDPIENDIVVLAVPYRAVQSVAERYGPELSGKVGADITNASDRESMDRLFTHAGSSPRPRRSPGSSLARHPSRRSTPPSPARSWRGRWPTTRSMCSLLATKPAPNR
jgi:predicted dinucleotide-binding enzyme